MNIYAMPERFEIPFFNEDEYRVGCDLLCADEPKAKYDLLLTFYAFKSKKAIQIHSTGA